MKKFILIAFTYLIGSTAQASWSNEEKNAFFELLYNPDKVVDNDSKIKMVNMIECVGSYYQSRYSFDQFKLFWVETEKTNLGPAQEFSYISTMCKKMVLDDKKTIWIWYTTNNIFLLVSIHVCLFLWCNVVLFSCTRISYIFRKTIRINLIQQNKYYGNRPWWTYWNDRI